MKLKEPQSTRRGTSATEVERNCGGAQPQHVPPLRLGTAEAAVRKGVAKRDELFEA
jgi:hypothetical protein